MRFIDIFSLILSLLGVYGIVYSLRLLLPRNIVPHVSTSLNEAMALLEHAEAINIPNMSNYRANLAMYACDCIQRPAVLTEPSLRNQFLHMRTESHRSPGFFQQCCLLFLCGLTWRLYDLKSRIEAIRRKIEVRDHPFYLIHQLIVSQLSVDEQQIAFLANTNVQSTTTALPTATATAGTHVICYGLWKCSVTVIPLDAVPMINAVEPAPPLPAGSSILNAA